MSGVMFALFIALISSEKRGHEVVGLSEGSVKFVPKEKKFLNGTYRQRIRVKTGLLYIRYCFFQGCNSSVGGAARSEHCNLTEITDTQFISNTATFAGAIYFTQANKHRFTRVLIHNNSALYMGAVYMDGVEESSEPSSFFTNVNFTFNHAAVWTGAVRVDHGAGPMKDSVFQGNRAKTCGAFFDFAWKPSQRVLSFVLFCESKSEMRAGAFCAFHLMHLSRFESCIFLKNKCDIHANSIYIESCNTVVELWNCTFDGVQDEEIEIRFKDSRFDIHEDCIFGKKRPLQKPKSPEE
jgi:hypothetical protein